MKIADNSTPSEKKLGMKTLRYWWKRKSSLKPEETNGHYYRVKHDSWGRVAMVQEFENGSVFIGTTQFIWKWNRIAKTVTYTPTEEIVSYQIYRRGWWGNLLDVERYSPDGKLIKIESGDL